MIIVSDCSGCYMLNEHEQAILEAVAKEKGTSVDSVMKDAILKLAAEVIRIKTGIQAA